MSKYYIDVEVVGSAKSDLASIRMSVNSVGQAVEALNSLQGKSAKAVEGLEKASKASIASELAGKIDQMGESLVNFSERAIDAATGLAQGLVQDAAMFEDAEASMRFAFGNQWEAMFNKTKAEAAKLSFTFEETLGLASSLGRLKINPFGTTNENVSIFKSKTGQMISALEVIQDGADAAGRGVDKMVFGLREAISDDWKSLRDALDLSKKDVTAWKKEMAKASDQQGKYNTLIQLIADRFGGAGALRAANFNKVLAQIPDLMQQIRASIGRAGLANLTSALQIIVEKMNEFLANKPLIAALSQAFFVLTRPVLWLVQAFATLSGWMSEAVAQMPYLPMIAAGLGLITIAATGLLGVSLSIGGALAGIAALIAVIGWKVVLLGVVASIALAPLLLVFSAATLTAIGAIVTALVGGAQYISMEWGGVLSIFDRMKILFTGLSELVSNYNGETSTMSVETAANLKKSGLFEFAMTALNVYHRLSTVWEGFMAGLDRLGAVVGPTVVAFASEFVSFLHEMFDALGLTNSLMAVGEGTTQDWATKGRELAEALMEAGKYSVELARSVLRWARENDVVGKFVTTMKVIWWLMKGIATVAETVLQPFISLARLIAAAVSGLTKLAELMGLIKKTPLAGPLDAALGREVTEGDILKKRMGANKIVENSRYEDVIKHSLSAPEYAAMGIDNPLGMLKTLGISDDAADSLRQGLEKIKLGENGVGIEERDALLRSFLREQGVVSQEEADIASYESGVAEGSLKPMPTELPAGYSLEDFLNGTGAHVGGEGGLAAAAAEGSDGTRRLENITEQVGNQTNARLDALLNAIQNQPVVLELDGETVAKAVRKSGGDSTGDFG